MKTIVLEKLTENKTFKIRVNYASVSFSQGKKKIPKIGYKPVLSAIWKVNNKNILEIISLIDGKWQIEKKRHQYTFVPEEPADKKWIVCVSF